MLTASQARIAIEWRGRSMLDAEVCLSCAVLPRWDSMRVFFLSRHSRLSRLGSFMNQSLMHRCEEPFHKLIPPACSLAVFCNRL